MSVPFVEGERGRIEPEVISWMVDFLAGHREKGSRRVRKRGGNFHSPSDCTEGMVRW